MSRPPDSKTFHADDVAELLEDDAPASRPSSVVSVGPIATRQTPPPLPPEAAVAASAPPKTASARPSTARRSRVVIVGALALLGINAGVVGGLVQTRAEERRAVAPIATISADVLALKAAETETREALDATRTELDDTRQRLVKQEKILESTTETVSANAARQVDDERDLKELEAREARDITAMAARMRLAERRGADGSYGVSLGEAVRLIDAVAPPKPSSADAGAEPPRPRTTRRSGGD